MSYAKSVNYLGHLEVALGVPGIGDSYSVSYPVASGNKTS